MAYKKVLRVFEHESDYYCEVRLWDSRNNSTNNGICVTGNHPIWVIEKGWVKAEELVSGDRLFSGWEDPTSLIVQEVDKEDEFPGLPVYNIEVEDFHTYFVGGFRVWGHNKNTPVNAFPHPDTASSDI